VYEDAGPDNGKCPTHGDPFILFCLKD
jgi:hypothetical protein